MTVSYRSLRRAAAASLAGAAALGSITFGGLAAHAEPAAQIVGAASPSAIDGEYLVVMEDDRHFFPNYNAAPEINSKVMKKWPAIAGVLDPISARLNNAVAQELNAKVDVDGEDPHQVALEWMKEQGFVK